MKDSFYTLKGGITPSLAALLRNVQKEDSSKGGRGIPAHPMQPVLRDPQNVIRFRENKVVKRLLNEAKIPLETILSWDLPASDKEQFMELLGCTIDGFGGLKFVRPDTLAKADAKAASLPRAKENMSKG